MKKTTVSIVAVAAIAICLSEVVYYHNSVTNEVTSQDSSNLCAPNTGTNEVISWDSNGIGISNTGKIYVKESVVKDIPGYKPGCPIVFVTGEENDGSGHDWFTNPMTPKEREEIANKTVTVVK